jgi:hypothetical protein
MRLTTAIESRPNLYCFSVSVAGVHLLERNDIERHQNLPLY